MNKEKPKAMTRRISRGTPAMLTVDEQKSFVLLLDTSPGLSEAIETLLNKKLTSMTFGEKVTAVANFLEMGHATAAVAQAAKAVNDLRNLASQARGDVSLSDKLALLETRLEDRDAALAQARDREQQLSSKITELIDQITNLQAQPARPRPINPRLND